LKKKWGNIDKFQEEYNKSCVGLFGSGWVWLAKDKDSGLVIVSASNADCPIRNGQTPILTCDVWEHAYYLDYKSQRAQYVEAWWKLVNWEFANENLSNNK